MATEIKIEGLDEVTKKLKQLSDPKKAKNAARRAARKALNIARDKAREKVKSMDDPSTPPKIYKEIVVQNGRTKDSGSIVMRLGVRGGAAIPYTNNASNRRSGKVGKSYKTDGRVFYWRFLELGTKHQPATPFLRPAFYESLQQMMDKFSQEFSAELSKELSKL